MNLPEAEQDFLRDLVKTARQRSHVVRWVDRDGSDRVTPFAAPEVKQLNRITGQLGISQSAVMQQAAFLPVNRKSI